MRLPCPSPPLSSTPCGVLLAAALPLTTGAVLVERLAGEGVGDRLPGGVGPRGVVGRELDASSLLFVL